MLPDKLVSRSSDAPAYWQVDILWIVLATGETTNGAYSLIEELCPRLSGPPPHTHTQLETFYIIDGEITFLVDGQIIKGTAGDYVAVPRGAVHSFRVDSETAHILNLYMPAGFERTIIELGEPALTRTLPPKNRPLTASRETVMKLFSEVGMKPVNERDVLRHSEDSRMNLKDSDF